MKLVEMRVKNYRTILADQTIRLDGGATVVGPNNSGKTNLLRAIQLFFTGYDNQFEYDRSLDLTFGAGRQQTSLTATFLLEHEDVGVALQLNELHRLVGSSRESDKFTVSLYFTDTNTPVYRVFENRRIRFQGDRPTFSRLQKKLVETVLGRFSLHFVPSAKRVEALYQDILHPFVISEASKVLAPHLRSIQGALNTISQSLNDELERAGLGKFEAFFSIPDAAPASLLAGFDFQLADPRRTSIWSKGQGLQSAALFASFLWVSKQEERQGLIPVWLIEEPESYLHPELAKACHALLESLATEFTLVTTTHSIAFMPYAVERIHGVELDDKNRTVVSSYANRAVATKRIRESLGVHFSDYFNLSRFNVFVEGPTDHELISWALTYFKSELITLKRLRSAFFQDHGGVTLLEGFLRANFPLISDECVLVSVFDGDDAGRKSRQNLQKMFGQKKIPFEPNEHFVSVRHGFAIEGLFPDAWIIQMREEHPGWFTDFAIDSQGKLEPFSIKDGSKRSAINYLKSLAELQDQADGDWAVQWTCFLQSIEDALGKQESRLAKMGRREYSEAEGQAAE